MSKKIKKDLENCQIYNKSCYGLEEIENNSIDALITDPPYGISVFNETWDKPKETDIPKPEFWGECLQKLKPGAFGLVFSFPRVMHRVMWHLEEKGFIIKDVLFWVYFNGMPKTRNIGLEIDKELGVESEVVGHYKYSQGYIKNGSDTYKVHGKKPILQPTSEAGKKYNGAGINIKPFYEPIILVQKRPTEATLVENMRKYQVGVLNLEDTRILYPEGEGKVGHNPHPKGRVAGNIITDEAFGHSYDKYFEVQPSALDQNVEMEYQELYEKMFFEAKVRQNAEDYNIHPTKKPVRLMEHLIKLLTWEGQTVLDPFMGSGSTGVACTAHNRNFIGYELETPFFEIAEKRLQEAEKRLQEAEKNRQERLDL